MNVLIVNTPCNGFGDIIFGWKIAKYLREWYPKNRVYIASTLPESLITLGENPKWVLRLGTKTYKQCRRVSRLELLTMDNKKITPMYDLYLVAPLQSDFFVNYPDIRTLFSNSTRENTFFFSEYNDTKGKCDFNTGIDDGRLGLLFTNAKGRCDLRKYGLTKNNYALSYLAETIGRSEICYRSFFGMVGAKYVRDDFHIVCPEWVALDLGSHRRIIAKLFHNYGTVRIVTKSDETKYSVGGTKGGTMHIRGDILPVPNEVMLGLMKNSVRDILLTGDQSITDVLSCCSQKNIFYQIAPWKKDLANKLARYLPNKYLSTSRSSCGTLGAIGYRGDYRKFVRKWDFRKLGRPLLDGLMGVRTRRRSYVK